MLKQKNSPECCYSCKEPPYISYKFKIIKNNNSSPPKNHLIIKITVIECVLSV